MSSFQIKLWACLFMLVDHAGLILFPDLVSMRIVGRLAFPLFAWAIANGFSHTRSAGRYLTRLFLFGLCIQLPYSWYFGVWQLNIFFTLSLGLLAIWFYRRLRERAISSSGHSGLGYMNYIIPGLVGAVAIGLLADAIQADYGLYGVLTIFLFYVFREDFRRLFLAQTALNLVNFLLPYLTYQAGGGDLSYMDWIQPLSLAALFFVYSYNGEKGRSWKYLFYVFYPAHLVVLYGIQQLLQ